MLITFGSDGAIMGVVAAHLGNARWLNSKNFMATLRMKTMMGLKVKYQCYLLIKQTTEIL